MELPAVANELAAHTADTAVRIRLTQALIELPGPTAQEVLRRLAHDDDRTVALVASASVGALDERSAGDRVASAFVGALNERSAGGRGTGQ